MTHLYSGSMSKSGGYACHARPAYPQCCIAFGSVSRQEWMVKLSRQQLVRIMTVVMHAGGR